MKLFNLNWSKSLWFSLSVTVSQDGLEVTRFSEKPDSFQKNLQQIKFDFLKIFREIWIFRKLRESYVLHVIEMSRSLKANNPNGNAMLKLNHLNWNAMLKDLNCNEKLKDLNCNGTWVPQSNPSKDSTHICGLNFLTFVRQCSGFLCPQTLKRFSWVFFCPMYKNSPFGIYLEYPDRAVIF